MQDQDLLDRLPGLSNLITDLNTRFLTPTGTSLHLDQDLHQARYALKHKKSYLETKTLFESVDRLRFLPLDNHHLSCSGSANALSYQAADLQRDISTHLDRLLSILETRRLVLASPTTANPSTRKDSRGSSTSNTTNGPGTDMSPSIVEILASRNKNHDHDAHIDLDEFVVDQLRPHLDALEGVSPFMIRTIHQSVQQRRQDVLSLYNNGITTTLDKDPTKNRANSFEDLIAQTKKQAVFLDRCKEDAVLHDLVVQNKTRKLFETMNQTVTTLWEVILEFKIRYQLDQDQTFREYFTQLVESLALKLEILKVTLQEHVYNKETIARLTTIREKIDRRHKSLTDQTHQNTLLLDRYKTAGPEFNTIVQTYTDIMHRIDIVQDDIRRLQ